MATVASPLQILESGRLRSFILPREHGAWGILLVPLLTGAAIGLATGRGVLPFILFIAASLSLFCLRTPLEAWLGTTPLRAQDSAERLIVLYAIVLYGLIAAFAVGWLLWRERAIGLVLIGAASGVFFIAQAILKKLGRSTRMVSQLLGAMGLTSTAAGAYYVVTGALNHLRRVGALEGDLVIRGGDVHRALLLPAFRLQQEVGEDGLAGALVGDGRDQPERFHQTVFLDRKFHVQAAVESRVTFDIRNQCPERMSLSGVFEATTSPGPSPLWPRLLHAGPSLSTLPHRRPSPPNPHLPLPSNRIQPKWLAECGFLLR